MIKDTNVQITAIIPKEVLEKIKKDAEENFCTQSTMIKNILISYYKKENKR